MRKTFIYIIAILATAAALSSCAKETPGPKPASEDGERVISATFGSASKSTLGEDGLTPEFKEGDLILVSNGTATQVCTLRVSGTLSTFTTKLEGTLTAVYPKDAAVVDANNSITGVKVPSSQTGLFKDANIAMAENITDHATFNNKTAMLRFYVDASIQVKSITITGSLNIATEGSNLKEIVVDADDAYIHTKTTGNPDERLCYVAVLPCPGTGTDISTNSLIFTSVTDSQETVTRTTTAKLKASGMYNAFIPYYIDMGAAGKWGYCNVGAFLPEEAGKYFAWGETEGRVPATSGTGAFTEKPFIWANAPFNNGSDVFNSSYFDSQIPTVCPGNVLALSYDAANVNWGENWCMPTKESIDLLLTKTTRNWVANYEETGVKGYLFANGNSIFFPAAGAGSEGDLGNLTAGYYWSKSLNPTYHNQSSILKFTDYSAPEKQSSYNKDGRSIRAIYDDSPGVINGGYENAGEY